MDEITNRLVNCFQTVFPKLPESKIPSAVRDTAAGWDSVASVILANVVEEEFAIEVDLDHFAELDSFSSVREYLQEEMRPRDR